MSELEQYLPKFDFSERHHLWVSASPKKCYQVLKQSNWRDSYWIGFLLWLRGIKEKGWMEKSFTLLYEQPGEEIVWGLIAQPWRWSGNVVTISKEAFEDFHQSGYVKVCWNFSFREENGGTIVATETRILCMDQESYDRFKWYWWCIRPFSGLIRRKMLQLIQRNSQKGS